MQRVTTVNLNGNAYQVEEGAYDALVAYLNRARATLEKNPDRAEIIADLEQAIADRCGRFLGPHKTVITTEDMEQVLKEMGPVEAAAEGAGEARTESKGAQTEGAAKGEGDREPQKRLYQLRDGAMLAGVCNGIGAYVGVDPMIIRLVFVALTALTHGVWILVYLVLALVLPVASPAEEEAAAHGAPFSARQVIDQAKANSAELRDKKFWKGRRREWKRELRRSIRRQAWASASNPAFQAGYAWRPWAGVMLPIFTLIEIGFLIVMVLAIVSLVNTGAVFGWMPPPTIPLWAGILILFVIYQIAVSPFRAARHAYAAFGPGAAWDALFGWVIVALVAWLAYTNVPEVREFVHRMPQIIHDVSRDLMK